jgi:hypothetical protein
MTALRERGCYHKLWLRFRNAGMKNKMLCKGDANLITRVVRCSKETKPPLQVLRGPPEPNRQERDAQNTIYYETEEENTNKPLIA